MRWGNQRALGLNVMDPRLSYFSSLYSGAILSCPASVSLSLMFPFLREQQLNTRYSRTSTLPQIEVEQKATEKSHPVASDDKQFFSFSWMAVDFCNRTGNRHAYLHEWACNLCAGSLVSRCPLNLCFQYQASPTKRSKILPIARYNPPNALRN